MKRIIKSIICLILYSQAYSQILNVELEAVDPNLTWPWNWDIVSDGDRLITVNEIGTLNIRQNGVWQNIEIDPNNNQLEPRSVDVDSEGNIWIATLEHGLWSYSMDNVFTNYNTNNSSLPTDKLRVLDIFENFIWISTSDSEGLIRYDIATEESLLFNMSNTSQLKTNGGLDPYVDLEGQVWIDNRECLSIINNDLSWTSQDFRPVVSGANINDIDFVSPDITILSADGGIVKAENGSYELIMQDNINDYNAYHIEENGTEWIHYTRITEAFLMVRNNGMSVDINSDSIEGIPSQVFKMIEHQDTIMMVGLLGNQIAKCTFDFISSSTTEEIIPIDIFPNPTADLIKIKGAIVKDSEYLISDNNGRHIKRGLVSNNQVSVDELDKGIYFLEISSQQSSSTYKTKFVVVR